MLSRGQVFQKSDDGHHAQQGAISFGNRPKRGDIDHVAEDLKKAQWYLNKAIEGYENENN